MKPIDPDLRFGQLAVRMGIITPQELPKLMVAARLARERAQGSDKAPGLGQILLRKKRLTVSEYLYVAREAEKSGDAEDAELEKLDRAFGAFQSGELDQGGLEEILRSSERATPRPPSREEAPPRFGRYELLGEIARGGMGIVYRARDTKDGAIHALKVMIEADDDDARLQRFEVEAELAQKLDHPGIVKVHDAGTIDAMPFFTMDLVDGKSLDDLLEKGIERARAIELLAQVARAVDHAHQQGIVHRDLKPGNILVENASGRARITDFGLARDMDRNTRITRVGQAVGTPYYMAPEQVRGERDVDGRADTYAIGVMLYEILTGDVPFDADSALTLFKKIDREPVTLPLDPERGIDARIRAIAMKCLEKKREDRYASARLLADDLERYLKGNAPRGQVHARAASVGRALARHRRAILVGVGGAAFVATAVLLLVAGWQQLAARRELAAGERDARTSVERALELVRAGEAALEASPGTAEAKAREARDLVARVERLAKSEEPFGRGEARGLELAGGDARPRALSLLGRACAALGRAQDADPALASAVGSLPPSPERAKLVLLLARVRRAKGDLAGALAALDDPGLAKDPVATVERGETRIEAGEVAKGIADLSFALHDGALPASERLRVLLARARAYVSSALRRADRDERQSALEAALEDARQAGVAAPDLAAPLLVEGDVLRARGQDDAALERYDSAARHEPRSPEPWVHAGDLLLARGSYALAAGAFDRAAAVPGGPSWEALEGRGLARAALFELDDARADLARAVARAAEEGGATDAAAATRARARARALVSLSEVDRARGDFGAARAALEDARALAPDAPAPSIALGRLALEGEAADPAAAEKAFGAARDRAAPESPESVEALEGLARARLAQHDLADARRLADLAVSALTTKHDARARRTSALVRANGSREGAQSVLDAAWTEAFLGEADPGTFGRLPELATILLARGWREAHVAAALEAAGRPAPELAGRASEELAAVTRLDPLRAPAWLALAELSLARGRFEPARKAAERCLEIDPLRARAHEVAARATLEVARDLAEGSLARAAQLGLALERATQAIALEPTAARLALRASVHAARGELEPAREDLEAARARAPGDVTVEAQLARVQALVDGKPADPEAARVRTARTNEQADLLEKARDAIAKRDTDRARDLAERAAAIGSPAADPGTRQALALEAALAPDPARRLELAAQALASGDGSLLDAADAALASAADEGTLALADKAERVGRAQRGDAVAATSLALVALEDALAVASERRVTADELELARRVAPASPAAWAAHALLAVRAGDAPGAGADLAVLDRLAPGSALVSYLEGEVAAAAGDRAKAADLVAAASKAGLASGDRRAARSPVLARMR